MDESTKDAGLIQVLLQRLETQRLPRALSLKSRVDGGEKLNDDDVEFLKLVFEDASTAQTLASRHPELQPLLARLISLYGEVTRKALENEGQL